MLGQVRTLLRAHTISGTVSEAEVLLASVCGNDDVLFHWDLLTGAVNIETKSTLLQEFAQLWLTIRVHAFTKMVLEEHKHDKQVTTAKAKALRAALQLDDRPKTDCCVWCVCMCVYVLGFTMYEGTTVYTTER